MAVHILIAFAITDAWLLSLYVRPFGRCWRCGGRGNLHRKGSRRAPVCPACKGMNGGSGSAPALCTAPSAWCAPNGSAPGS
jgi:hypothetical protein